MSSHIFLKRRGASPNQSEIHPKKGDTQKGVQKIQRWVEEVPETRGATLPFVGRKNQRVLVLEEAKGK